MIKIDKKITGYTIKKKAELTYSIEEKGDRRKAELSKLDRPLALEGKTYKIKPQGHDSALYLTINHIVIDDKLKPFEIFINSKHMESYPWISLVTRLVSSIFRTGSDSTFVIEEFESIFDPSNGYWGKEPNKPKGKYYNSYIAELGAILRYHMEGLEILKPVHSIKEEMEMETVTTEGVEPKGQVIRTDKVALRDSTDVMIDKEIDSRIKNSTGVSCTDCGESNMKMLDSCLTCLSCGYSKCG